MLLEGLDLIGTELMLFAAVGFLIGGLDELLVDIFWLARTGWRRLVVYRYFKPATAATLAGGTPKSAIAVFVAAWDEAAVIGPMLAHCKNAWAGETYRLFVGCYPNDPATRAVIETVDNPNMTIVTVSQPGPTTKADCLNTLWQALLHDEAKHGRTYSAIVLHDAEDVVHSAEIKVFSALAARFDLIQLPVVPLVDYGSRWIAGHYADEFAEAHGKALVVREAIGAGLPSAGVGCAFSRTMLGRIAGKEGDGPFDATSLTEDYELGLRIKALRGREAMVRICAADGAAIVATRAHFPSSLDAAVRQKARWMTGIALQGWDRLGWGIGIGEYWMRLRDRRALFAAALLCAGYLALLIATARWGLSWLLNAPAPALPQTTQHLLTANAGLLLWRLGMRFVFVARLYGWREGLRSIPRIVTANVIAVMAARRAILTYLCARRDGSVRWDKTTHVFPTQIAAE
jgi:bacteriophage N4 adsorption protein B